MYCRWESGRVGRRIKKEGKSKTKKEGRGHSGYYIKDGKLLEPLTSERGYSEGRGKLRDEWSQEMEKHLKQLKEAKSYLNGLGDSRL